MGPKKKKAAGPVRGFATTTVEESWENQPVVPVAAHAESNGTEADPGGVGADENAAAKMSSIAMNKVDAEIRIAEAKRIILEEGGHVGDGLRVGAALEREVRNICAEALKWLTPAPHAVAMENGSVAPEVACDVLMLERLGFAGDVCEQAMKETGGFGLAECVDWICVNVPGDQLPPGFADKVNLDSEEATLNLVGATPRAANEVSAVTFTLSKSTEPPAATPAPELSKTTTVDSKLKSRILQLTSLSDDELDDLEPLHAPKLPLYSEHALLHIQTDELKVMGRIKEVETERGWTEKVKRKADVEYARLIRERVRVGVEEEAAEVKAEVKVEEPIHHDDDDDDDNEGIGGLFTEEPSTPAPQPVAIFGLASDSSLVAYSCIMDWKDAQRLERVLRSLGWSGVKGGLLKNLKTMFGDVREAEEQLLSIKSRRTFLFTDLCRHLHRSVWLERESRDKAASSQPLRDAETQRLAFLNDLLKTWKSGNAAFLPTKDGAKKIIGKRKRRRRWRFSVDAEDAVRLKEVLERRRKGEGWRRLREIREGLPVFGRRKRFGDLGKIPQFILEHMIDTLRGPTTQILCTQPRRISATSIASRVSEEMADPIQNSISVGNTGSLVGHIVRLDARVSPSTRLVFCTTGVLLRRLETDPTLTGISHIVVDEVHERSLDTDFLLVLIRRLLITRTDLKVVLMSATADAERFASYFRGVGDVPVLTVPGRTYPVTQMFLEEAVEHTGYVLERGSEFEVKAKGGIRRDVGVTVTGKGGKGIRMRVEWEEAIKPAISAPVGDDDYEDDDEEDFGAQAFDATRVSKATLDTLSRMDPTKINLELVEALIRKIVDGELEERLEMGEGVKENRGGKMIVIPLHSLVGAAEQALAFKPPPYGKRKVILSTNIAETGITLPDVVYVVDTCRAREVSYDDRRHVTRLGDVLIARANGEQRRGRAGRVGPGVCYHLVGREVYEGLPKHRPPEILRLPLEELVLRGVAMLSQGRKAGDPMTQIDISSLLAEALDPPPAKHVDRAVTILKQIQALTLQATLTPLGSKLVSLPTDARLGKMILHACAFRCLDPILTVAASLSLGKDPFAKKFEDVASGGGASGGGAGNFKTVDSDLLAIHNAFSGWRNAILGGKSSARDFAAKNGLSFMQLVQIEEARAQLLRGLVDAGAIEKDVLLGKKLPYPLLTSIPALYSQNITPSLLLTVLATGLYPSILVLKPTPSHLPQFLNPPQTPTDRVRIHRRSILHGQRLPPGFYASHSVTGVDVVTKSGVKMTAWDLNRVGSLGVLFGGNGEMEVLVKGVGVGEKPGRWYVKCVGRTGGLVARFLGIVRRGVEMRMEKGRGSEVEEKAVDLFIRLVEAEGKVMGI
ncbi:hypothetical protein BC829DRAFT_446354 [Chytridium lagenaria]|nr:hypothetical protein BC829DRAFT_446354 [Chytridium lagenaria]